MSGDQLALDILRYVEKNDNASTLKIASEFQVDHQKVIGAVKSIQACGELITAQPVTEKSIDLTPEGELFVNRSSHEYMVWSKIPEEGMPQNEVTKLPDGGKIGFSKAMALGWVSVDKSTGQPIVKRKILDVEDKAQNDLRLVKERNYSKLTDIFKQEYKKRKLITENPITYFLLNKGADFSTNLQKGEADLTSDMITSGKWKDLQFKSYNFEAKGTLPLSGFLHPLLKVRTEFRQIFLEMGFSEMPTNNYVESSFWNFDALFQPQQHPARDAHDTFFVSEPATTEKFPEDYLAKVKEVHSNGGYGSLGYRYDWDIAEAQKNLLRTHTTAVSARMLYNLGQQKEFKPLKLFSIDRVFRNETLDATHLAEFHQVEGVIADYNLTLGDLIGVFAEFFKKLGLTELEFKPAYNPYTEPSMEIFCFHKGLNKWIEIGNSGMFRPEMLRPMGLPEDVQVLAWGLSLERPTMIKYGYSNIRSLVGPKVDLQMVETNPLCRMDK